MKLHGVVEIMVYAVIGVAIAKFVLGLVAPSLQQYV